MADDTRPNASFDIRKIYLKDASFESPGAPDVFLSSGDNPNIDIEAKLSHSALEQPNNHEVVMTITTTAKVEDSVVFLVEVVQAGVFTLQGLTEQEVPLALEIAAPNALLPFAREAISDLVTKGGFPQFLIAPINFEALHRSKTAQAQVQH